jgi:hypothetical protein
MVFGAEKLWVIDYRDHPTLGMCNFLNVFTPDGKHSEIPLRFDLPDIVIAESRPISRLPKPVKLDENCVHIEWMAASEKGLTFFTGDASDRTYAKGIWFLPMTEINAWSKTKKSRDK